MCQSLAPLPLVRCCILPRGRTWQTAKPSWRWTRSWRGSLGTSSRTPSRPLGLSFPLAEGKNKNILFGKQYLNFYVPEPFHFFPPPGMSLPWMSPSQKVEKQKVQTRLPCQRSPPRSCRRTSSSGSNFMDALNCVLLFGFGIILGLRRMTSACTGRRWRRSGGNSG